MRILIFSLCYYPRHIGGAEVAVKEITDRLGERCEFDMITLRKKASAFERIGNVNVYRVALSSKLLYIPLALLKALSLMRKKSYDAVWPIMASYAGFAALLVKKVHPAIPLVLTIQEGDHFERREGVFRPFFRMIFKGADRITAISRFLAEWAQHMGARAPIYIIPNGVSAEAFAKREKKKEFGFLKTDQVIMTTSRLVEKNGISDLIRSLTYLPEEVKLVIVGTGNLGAKLRKETRDFGLESRVTFAGFVSHSEIPAYLQSANVFVRPSLSEGLGNSFLEAMAAGVPVVATPVGGIVDFLENGKTGLFCEVHNPQSIAMQVRLLLGNDEFRKILVANAARLVRERYNWEGIAKAMREVFIQVQI